MGLLNEVFPASEPRQQTAFERFLRGVKDPLDGAAQFLVHSAPQAVADVVNGTAAQLNADPIIGRYARVIGMTPATPSELDRRMAAEEADYQARRQAAGSYGTDYPRFAGGLLSSVPFLASGTGAGSVGAGMARGMAAGAAYGAASPVTDDLANFWRQKIEQMQTGAVMGGAGGSNAGRVLPVR